MGWDGNAREGQGRAGKGREGQGMGRCKHMLGGPDCETPRRDRGRQAPGHRGGEGTRRARDRGGDGVRARAGREGGREIGSRGCEKWCGLQPCRGLDRGAALVLVPNEYRKGRRLMAAAMAPLGRGWRCTALLSCAEQCSAALCSALLCAVPRARAARPLQGRGRGTSRPIAQADITDRPGCPRCVDLARRRGARTAQWRRHDRTGLGGSSSACGPVLCQHIQSCLPSCACITAPRA